MTVREAALLLKAWAAENDALGYSAIEEFDDEPESIADVGAIGQVASTEAILKQKRIALIGIDDAENKIVVYTQRRLTKDELSTVSERAGSGYEVDFRYLPLPKIRSAASSAPQVTPYDLTASSRYTCGSSVFISSAIDAGTLGAIVVDGGGTHFGLSNNHVVAACNYAKMATPIMAPGMADVRPHGIDPFTIGHHSKALSLLLGDPDNVDATENLDAAMFSIPNPNTVSSMQRSAYDTPTAVAMPPVGTRVEKVGRTTGRTRGKVTILTVGVEPVEVSVPAFGFRGVAFFADFFCIEGESGQHFALPGDSGSLITFVDPNGERKSAGLVFAVNTAKSLTYAVPIDRILNRLGVGLVSGHNI